MIQQKENKALSQIHGVNGKHLTDSIILQCVEYYIRCSTNIECHHLPYEPDQSQFSSLDISLLSKMYHFPLERFHPRFFQNASIRRRRSNVSVRELKRLQVPCGTSVGWCFVTWPWREGSPTDDSQVSCGLPGRLYRAFLSSAGVLCVA